MSRLLALAFALLPLASFAAERSLTLTRRYLNFPVSHRTDRRTMRLSVDGQEQCHFVIRLAEGEEDYWVFQDVSGWRGKTVRLHYDGPQAALDRVFEADTFPGEATWRDEPLRPRYHFTTRRGWINDPNGLVYADGTYHLFYQHNPFEREWENMHWGHATSTDLLHWTECPDALHPDALGTMFSGSAIIDSDNAAGFNDPRTGKAAMIAFYTADSPERECQCMAYSLDDGLTFTKFGGNPVVDSHERWQSRDTRDPKVFFYAPARHWVMVLNERDGHTIYTSTDLRTWQPASHITGFWECPELFELPVEGQPGERYWVMWGASGVYIIGQFDGRTFTPETPKLQNHNGTAYAAQCYNNIPATDGRVIKVAWARIDFDGAPFNGTMLLPQQQRLCRTPQGLRLMSRPVEETDRLFTTVLRRDSLSADEANDLLRPFAANDHLRIRARLQLTYATDASLSYRGQKLLDYNLNGNYLNGAFYVNPYDPTSLTLDLDCYIDGPVVEWYVDGGAFASSLKRDLRSRTPEGYLFRGNHLQVTSLEVATLGDVGCRVKT